MKKTFITCMAIAGLLALAGSAGAITCTIDQRPAATLLVPYFEVTFNPDGSPLATGPNARDTLVTICNASAAPMLVHFDIWSERTELILDFNMALTGFDCQAMRMSDLLRGNIPRTGFVSGGVLRDACQRNFGAGATQSKVFPTAGQTSFLRVLPTAPANVFDNLATTVLPSPAWPAGSQFAFEVLDSLDETDDSRECGGVDRVFANPIRGYMTIDHANYCTLSNPSDERYWLFDAAGMENNLFGEVIFTSGSGIPTMGGSTVNIEAATNSAPPGTGNPGRPFEVDKLSTRTFYARYWLTGNDTSVPAPGGCPNCVGTLAAGTNLFLNSPWNIALGDAREPLGLKYAARWFSAGGISSNFNVWRASIGEEDGSQAIDRGTPLVDLLGSPLGDCDVELPFVNLIFFDEDENSFATSCPFSPCIPPTFNFPLETQRANISLFSGALPPGSAAGWVSMGFFNAGAPLNGQFDQAWVEYDFQGSAAFLSMSAPGTQLDPSACNPLGTTLPTILPVIPAVRGTGP